LILSGTLKASGLSRLIRRLGLMRKLSSTLDRSCKHAYGSSRSL